MEDLVAQVAPGAAARPRTLRQAGAGTAMARGRTCHDHLAGWLGIAVTDAFPARGLLLRDTGFALTEAGVRWFAAAGVGPDRRGRRPLARACPDWTERRPHLAGVAGAALCRHALQTGWCVRIGSERAVKVTEAGERALSGLLGVPAQLLR